MSKKLSSSCCANCIATNLPLSTCGKCGIEQYCSIECQKQHWINEHKLKCVKIELRKPPTESKKVDQSNSTNSDICCICMDSVNKQDRFMPCPHLFHRECIDKWLELNKRCPLCNLIFTEDEMLCVEYIRLIRKPDAIKINKLIQRLTSKSTYTAYTLNILGDLYMIINQILKAEDIFKLAEKDFPKDIRAYINLAKLYTNIGHRVIARKYHEKSLKLLKISDTTTDIELVVLLNYAIFLIQSPEIPEISRDFSVIAKANTFDKKLQIIEHNSNFSSISPEDAEYASMLIERVMQIDPTYPKIYLVKAKLTSNNDEKLSCYNYAIKYDINRSPLSHYNIATILINTNYKKASVYYKLAIRLNKNLIEERISYFLMLSKCGYIKEGKQIIIEILEDFPTNEKVNNLFKIFNSTVYPMFEK